MIRVEVYDAASTRRVPVLTQNQRTERVWIAETSGFSARMRGSVRSFQKKEPGWGQIIFFLPSRRVLTERS